jgi:C-terminal processing protease CtpA/Prc
MLAADEEASRHADHAEKIAIATLDPQVGETAMTNGSSFSGAPLSAVALLIPEKSARSGDGAAKMSVDPKEAVTTADVFNEIEHDDVGVHVFQATEDITGELDPRAEDGAPDGEADPQTISTEDEVSRFVEEAENISVRMDDAPKEKKNDMANGAPNDRVPVLGVTLLLPEKSAGGGGQGVVIMNVDRNGAAADNGIRAGNVILEVDDRKVFHPAQVIAAIATAKKDGRRIILMRIKTLNTTRIVQFFLEEEEV